MIRMIIDTDAGIDDAQAIMMALAHPSVTVEALTTLTGNVHVDKVIPNVFTVLDVMQKNAPVYRGAERPLIHDWHPADYVHGEDGLGNLAQRPPSTRALEPEHAALALVKLANESPGELTLIALGPLTNVALAIHLDPAFPSKIKAFIFMGGTIAAKGNTPSVTAEWNIFCDPEAAYIVLKAFPLSTMVSWETTLEHPMAWDKFEELCSQDSASSRFFKAISSDLLGDRMNRYPGYLFPDPLAMAVALEPGLVKSRERRFGTVELHGALTRGQTVIDYRLWNNDKTPNLDIVTALDNDRFFALLKQAVSY